MHRGRSLGHGSKTDTVNLTIVQPSAVYRVSGGFGADRRMKRWAFHVGRSRLGQEIGRPPLINNSSGSREDPSLADLMLQEAQA